MAAQMPVVKIDTLRLSRSLDSIIDYPAVPMQADLNALIPSERATRFDRPTEEFRQTKRMLIERLYS